ncbi:Signal peptide peptidase-like protein 2B [Trichuris trichiura]|uniref:Signal peptide peptidase-like protein 2B n=1 Tax=Trichuris trichiura TaxID=36087 RepID=A0A077Z5E4_TRITR|nr:Signal peptide peptidase-like protein 2B [Trichuris trichiura]
MVKVTESIVPFKLVDAEEKDFGILAYSGVMSRFSLLIFVGISLLLSKWSSSETVSSTIIYAHCVNKRTNLSAVLCGNYQIGSKVASYLEEAPTFHLAFWPQNDDHWCSVPDENISFFGKAVFGILESVNDSACSSGGAEVNERLDVLKSRGGEVALFQESPLRRWYSNPYVNISRFNGSVFYFDSPTVHQMERLYQNNRNQSEDVELRFYTSEVETFNVAYFLNVLIPTVCVILGGIWSGRSRELMFFPTIAKKRQPAMRHTFNAGDDEAPDNHTTSQQKSEPKQEEIDYLSCAGIVIAGTFTISLILLLYFFYDYLVWVFLVIYVIGSADSLYKCLMLVIANSRLLEYESGSHFATIFLSMFLFYDVFMVSGSPYLTKGCSIMTYVATGGFCNQSEMIAGSYVWKESLPLVFLFPHVTANSFQCLKFSSITSYPFALYGIGDVILPAYALGTTITYSVGRLLSTSQPALLYLVPSVLIPVHVIGLCRGEWKKLWKGELSIPVVAAVRADSDKIERRSRSGQTGAEGAIVDSR